MRKLSLSKRLALATGVLALVALGAYFGDALRPGVANAPSQAEEEEPDSPGEAYEWRLLAWRDENGAIPPDGLKRAREHLQKILRDPARIMAGSNGWTERGPYNVAGRTRSLLIDPRDPNHMLTGSVGGGIWKSTNGGTTWAPVNDKMPNLAIGCLTRDPNNPDVIYAGTGEGFFNSDAISGDGIYKSTNNGNTWTKIDSTDTFGNVNRIAVAPGNSNLIIAAVRPGGLMRSTDGGFSWQNVPGFHQVGHQVVFHPTDPNKVMATFLDFANSTWHCKAMFSTNGGATWTESNGLRLNGFERVEVGYAPSTPDVIYANSSGSGGKIFKSVDGGANFVQVTATGVSEANWYNNAIWIDPVNPLLIVATGTNTYRSIDGGVTLTKISDGYILTEQAHPDVHLAVPHPNYNGTTNRQFFVCTDGGVHKTNDILTVSQSSGWSRLTRDARTTQFYGVAAHGGSGLIIGGTQDNGTLSLSVGTNNAQLPFGGDGGWCAIDPANPNRFYGEYIYLRIWRTTDGGNDSNYIYSGITDVNGSANFIAPFVMDPNNANVLLGGGSNLWRTTNATGSNPTWSSIKPPIGSNISAIAVAEGNSNIVWVGHNNGRVYMSTDATAASPTWTLVDGAGGQLPDRYVGRILIDKSNHSKVYIGFGGFDAQNLWMTTNGGSTWSARVGTGANTLPPAPIRALARHPNDPNLLHVGTEVGICESLDGGLTWSAPTDGPLNVSVDDLQYMHGTTKLVAGTHGRGIWILGPLSMAGLTGPSTVNSGANAMFTVTLDGEAGTGGAIVNLSSNHAGLTVPATVTVPAKSAMATFNASAGTVTQDTDVTVTATLNGTSRNAVITVKSAQTLDLTLTPTSLVGGNSATGRITLPSPAPSGGTTVTLSTDTPNVVAFPNGATVSFAAGETTKEFPINTSGVAAQVNVNISAKQNNVGPTKALTVTPAVLTSLNFNPARVLGGNTSTGTVTLNGKAGSTFTVSLSIDAGTAGYTITPQTLTFNPGDQQKTFVVQTATETTNTKRTITATRAGNNPVSNDLLVDAVTLTAFAINPTQVSAGQKSVGTVTISTAAPSTGVDVNLASSDTQVATVPAKVTVPAGATSVNFDISTSVSLSDRDVTITASRGATQFSRTLSTIGATFALALNATSVKGGLEHPIGTVTLAVDAPSTTVVTLASTNTNLATVPASVTIPAGGRTATFTVTTKGVATTGSTTIRATISGNTKSANLEVRPVGVSGVIVKPNRLRGGGSVLINVRLEGPAPAGGLLVNLSTGGAFTNAPTQFRIPAGRQDASLTLRTKRVGATTTYTITATSGGVSASAPLTVLR